MKVEAHDSYRVAGSCGSRAAKIAARQIVGGRRAHQICRRFCGVVAGHYYRAGTRPRATGTGRPASRNDGLVFTNAWLTGPPPVPFSGGGVYSLSTPLSWQPCAAASSLRHHGVRRISCQCLTALQPHRLHGLSWLSPNRSLLVIENSVGSVCTWALPLTDHGLLFALFSGLFVGQ